MVFVSFIQPFNLTNFNLYWNSTKKFKKIFVKQSYILMTWFFYLKHVSSGFNLKKKINFFVLPTKSSFLTNTKAPMAHKKNSKEQYGFSFYKFKLSFDLTFNYENELNCLNKSLLFIILSKKKFPNFETNVFFIKSFFFVFYAQDKHFFNYSKFIFK